MLRMMTKARLVRALPEPIEVALQLSVHDPGCLHDPSAHAHNDVVEDAHAQMTILFCDDLRHCTISSTLAQVISIVSLK
jgi:hypothetical protein